TARAALGSRAVSDSRLGRDGGTEHDRSRKLAHQRTRDESRSARTAVSAHSSAARRPLAGNGRQPSVSSVRISGDATAARRVDGTGRNRARGARGARSRPGRVRIRARRLHRNRFGAALRRGSDFQVRLSRDFPCYDAARPESVFLTAGYGVNAATAFTRFTPGGTHFGGDAVRSAEADGSRSLSRSEERTE